MGAIIFLRTTILGSMLKGFIWVLVLYRVCFFNLISYKTVMKKPFHINLLCSTKLTVRVLYLQVQSNQNWNVAESLSFVKL